MKQILRDESAQLAFGRQLAASLRAPVALELVGDVGTGKTTLVKGLAEGLGITEEVTSPSFTISKQYTAPSGLTLVHYDFYRLPDPGLMADDLLENLSSDHTITVVEWADSVSDFLPANHQTLYLTLNPDGSRTISDQPLTEQEPA